MRSIVVGTISLFCSLAAASPQIPTSKGETIVRYEQGGEVFESRLVESRKRAKANLLMFPNWLGPDTVASVNKAQMLARKGYNVFLADVYGITTRPQNPQEAGAAAGALYSDRELFRQRTNRALQEFQNVLGENIGKGRPFATIGFCFGGSASLELARSGAEVPYVVAFHSNLNTPSPEDAKNIAGRILVLHGHDDPIVPQEEIRGFEQEMTAAGIDWTFVNFSNTVHSFTDPTANAPGVAEYNPRSARRAFAAMDLFIGSEP